MEKIFDFVPAPDRKFESDFEEAIVTAAENARIRGFYIQYDDTRLVEASDTTPKEYRFAIGTAYHEDATAQNLNYTNCACFTYDMYMRTFGTDIIAWTTERLAASDMRVFDYRPTGAETEEEKAEIERKFRAELRRGDILNFRRVGKATGHAMLYIGDGMIIHSTAPGGGNYDYETRQEKLEPDGSIVYLSVSDLFDSQSKRYFFDKEVFSIVRPSVKYDLKITEDAKNRVKNLKNIYTEKTASHLSGHLAAPGEEITFTFRAVNRSGKDAELCVRDSVPENTEYVRGGKLEGKNITFTLSVPNGGDAAVSYTVRVKNDPSLCGKYVWTQDAAIGGVSHRCPKIFIGYGKPEDRKSITDAEIRELFGADKDGILSSLFKTHANPDYQTLNLCSPFIKYIAPTMYGGRYVVMADIFDGERTRGVLKEQIYSGDIIICSEKADSAAHVFLNTKDGIFDMQTGKTESENAQDILYSLLGYYRFVILRPSQNN